MVYLETPRLILRDFKQEDVSQLAPILATPQVMKFSPTGPLSESQTQARINSFINSYQAYGFGKWAVIFKNSGMLIGYCGIAMEEIDNLNQPEIGFRLTPAYWGKGLATEATSMAVQYGLEQLKLPYLLGMVERANLASVRVLEKLGMEYRKETVFHGVRMDIYQIQRK